MSGVVVDWLLLQLLFDGPTVVAVYVERLFYWGFGVGCCNSSCSVFRGTARPTFNDPLHLGVGCCQHVFGYVTFVAAKTIFQIDGIFYYVCMCLLFLLPL